MKFLIQRVSKRGEKNESNNFPRFELKNGTHEVWLLRIKVFE